MAAELKAVSSDLDELLARYERMFDASTVKPKGSQLYEKCLATRHNKIPTYNVPISPTPHMLKPRVPTTVRERLQRQQKHEHESADALQAELLQQHQQELAQSLVHKESIFSEEEGEQKDPRMNVQDFSAQEEEYSDEPENRTKTASYSMEKQRESESKLNREERDSSPYSHHKVDSETNFSQNRSELVTKYTCERHRDDTDSNFSQDSRDKVQMAREEHREVGPSYSREMKDSGSIYSREGREIASSYSREDREVGSNYSREARENPCNYSRDAGEAVSDYSQEGREAASNYSQDARDVGSNYSREERREHDGDYKFDRRERSPGYNSGDQRDDESSSSREPREATQNYYQEQQKKIGSSYQRNYLEKKSNIGDQIDDIAGSSDYYRDQQKNIQKQIVPKCEHRFANRLRNAQGDVGSKHELDANSVLGGLLSDLLSRGCIPSISEEQKRSLQSLYSQLQHETRKTEQPESRTKSFSLSSLPNKSVATYHGLLYEPDRELEAVLGDTGNRKPREEDLALKDSKDYIVSMIDSALDRELETISEETAAEKRAKERKTKKVNISDLHTETPKNDDIFVRMDVAQAIDLVNSESSCGINTDLCREITQTLTDSLVTKKSKNSTMPMDNYVLVPAEEPAYLRQLRQLRWDHLKHIQREVKRLEDLEKFLDTCNSGLSVCETVSSPS